MGRRLQFCALILFLCFDTARAQAPDTTMRGWFARLPDLPIADLNRTTSPPVMRGFALLELQRRGRDAQGAWKAARIFADVIRQNSSDAWAHYGLGMALAREPRAANVLRTAGIPKGAALSHLNEALQLEPGLPGAEDLLASLGGASSGPRVATLERIDTAAVIASQPVTARDFLRRGAVLFARHQDAAAAQSYLKGIEVWDSADAQAYFEHAALVANRQELISLSDGSLQKRAEALRLFWKKRAVRDGTTIEARLAEHFRRIQYALAYFPLRGSLTGSNAPVHTVYGKTRRGLEAELDDRGVIYVRFGEPFTKVFEREQFGPEPGEAWIYKNPEGRPTIFLFKAGRIESNVFRLVTSKPNELGDAPQFIADLARYDGRYGLLEVRYFEIATVQKSLRPPEEKARLLAFMVDELMRANDRLTDRAFNAIFAAYEADAARPMFDKPLVAFHDFATFRGQGCTDVVYSVAAPGPSYQVSVALADTFTWDVKTIEGRATVETSAGNYVRSTAMLCMPPDNNAFVRLTIACDSVTGVTAGGELRIPDYSGPDLMMSDMLFATVEAGKFVRGRAHLALVPPRQFRQNEPFRLFYEIYNLPAGRTYQTEIKLTTVEPNIVMRLLKGKQTLTLTFEESAQDSGVVQQLRTIVPEIDDGKVLLEIKVTDTVTGQSATARETIWVLPRREPS